VGLGLGLGLGFCKEKLLGLSTSPLLGISFLINPYRYAYGLLISQPQDFIQKCRKIFTARLSF
jgi:hypothetical protein